MDMIWFGTETSLQSYLDKIKRLEDPVMMGHLRSLFEKQASLTPEQEPEEEPLSRLVTRQGTTAVMKVHGELTNSKEWYDEYLGLVSYEEIIETLESLAVDESFTEIVADFGTGGGTAMGIKEAGDMISYVDQNFKPVHAYTGSAALSAGYWLASSARSITVAPMGRVGSIGAVTAHVSYKDMLDKAGIVFTVFREGEYKALGQPFEKLDDKAREEIQSSLRETNAFFLDQVMTSRKLTMATHSEWGEGKVFYGSKAVALGLADQVGNMRTLLGQFSSQSSGAGRTMFGDTSMNVHTNKPGTSKPGDEALQGDSKTPAAEDSQEVANPEAENLDNASAEDQALAALDNLEPSSNKEGTSEDELLLEAEAQMQGDDETPGALEVLQAEKTALEEKLSAAEQDLEAMKGFMLQDIDRRMVAMGGTPIDMSDFDVQSLVSFHAKVVDKFKQHFKAGATSKASSMKHETVEEQKAPKQSAGTYYEEMAAAKRAQA